MPNALANACTAPTVVINQPCRLRAWLTGSRHADVPVAQSCGRFGETSPGQKSFWR
jgi:hypothetical protein